MDRLRRFILNNPKADNTRVKKQKKSSECSRKIIKKREIARQNKKKGGRRISSSETSSEDDTHIQYDDSSDTESFCNNSSHGSDQDSKNQDQDRDQDSRLEPEVELNKFYAVYYDSGWFIGEIEAKMGKTFRMKFLKEKKMGVSFIGPKKQTQRRSKKSSFFSALFVCRLIWTGICS